MIRCIRTVENRLSNLGLAYADLGDARRAIGYYEQALQISREVGDVLTSAMIVANLAMAMAQIGRVAEAIPLIQQAILDFRRAGYPQQAQQAERMLARLQGGGPMGSGPSPAEILRQLTPVIEAVLAAAHGNQQARAAVGQLLPKLERNGWRIVQPIQRIWAGERDEAALTAGLDPNSALIVREILKRLNQ